MKKAMIILFFLTGFIFSQNNSPFQVGNRWDFLENEWNGQGQGSRDTVSYTIYADTLLPNGKTYFRIAPYSWYLKDFVRSDSVGVYYYDLVNEREWLFYKYDLELSTDVYPYGPYLEVGYERNITDTNNYFKIYKWVEGKTSKFGDSIQVYAYNCDVDTDNGYQISVSPKIGFFSVHAPNFFSNFDMGLLACKINGVTYGELIDTYEKDSLKKYLDYYPLQVGNYWQYLEIVTDWMSTKSEYFSLEITKDTVLSNGKKYYVFEERNLSKGAISNIYFERIDSLTSLVYRYIDTEEFVIDSLAVQVDSFYYGSRLYSYGQPGVQTLCIGESEEVILGETFTVKEFDTQGLVGHYYKLAKGLGYSSHWGAEITTWSRSLIYAEVNGKVLGDKVTSVKNKGENLPSNITLYPNYPNPFNPRTKISFYIPSLVRREHAVFLQVYDILGRKISTLINNENISGYHEIEFDASNIPSGIYFYKLTVGKFSQTKKMLLLK